MLKLNDTFWTQKNVPPVMKHDNITQNSAYMLIKVQVFFSRNMFYAIRLL